MTTYTFRPTPKYIHTDTSLIQGTPWKPFEEEGHKVLCADGKIRAARITSELGSIESTPATVNIDGIDTEGTVLREYIDGVRVYVFHQSN